MAGRGFTKLRIVVAGSIALSAVGGVAGQAHATLTSAPQTHTGNSTTWHVANSHGLSDSSFPNASAYGLVAMTRHGTTTKPTLTCPNFPTSSCFTTFVNTPSTQAEGFGGGGAFFLAAGNGVFVAPPGKVDVEPDSITATAKLSGFKVEYRTVFFDNGVAAVLYSFKNPTTKAKTARIRIGSRFASPSIGADESGDSSLHADDSWFEVAPTVAGIPTVTVARGDCDFGATGCAHADVVKTPTSNASADWIEAYKFSVKPKKTKRLLFYVEMDKGGTFAQSYFDSRSALEAQGLLDPFTDAEKAQIVNWQKTP